MCESAVSDNIGRSVIELQRISGYGYHGVLPEERREGQHFSVDVSYALDMRRAAESDELIDTVSYADIAQRVHRRIVGEPVKLLETLAHRIADDVLVSGPISAVTVRIHKPQAPISVPFEDVVVSVTRTATEPLVTARHVIIALGANLGNPARMLENVIDELTQRPDLDVRAASPILQSTAVGLDGPDATRPTFANAVMSATTTLGPLALLDVLHAIEDNHGRVRKERWGDRTLDLDIIDYAGEVWQTSRLTLPHPRAGERSFVIQPWLTIEPDAELVGLGPIRNLPAAQGSL